MTDWVSFEGRIEPLVWGRATYTILRLPPDVARTLAATRRVEGEINDHPVNLAITRAPVVDDPFLWAGQSLMDRVGVIPGELLQVRLMPTSDDIVDNPPDVEAALLAHGLLTRWGDLTPGKRRGLLYKIDTARTDATRQKRITALISDLQANP